jgi:hypothetical protein
MQTEQLVPESDAVGVFESLRGTGVDVTPTPEHIEAAHRAAHPKYCGRFSLRGRAFDGTETRYMRVKCKCWNCAHCAPRKAARYKHSIRENAEKMQLRRFLTLTLDPKKNPGAEPAEHAIYLEHTAENPNAGALCQCVICERVRGLSVAYIRECWGKFRTYLRRAFRDPDSKKPARVTFIAVLEFQLKKTGFAHLHVLIDRYISQQWVTEVWAAIGGGSHVDIRLVDLHRVSHYLAKYLTKELLMSAPKRSRRITTSRDIHLTEKPEPKHVWEILKTTIQRLFQMLAPVAVSLAFDEGQLLEAFVVKNQPCYG